MPSIERLGHRFEGALKTLDGRRFFGRIVELPENAPTSVTPAKRLLRVHPNTFLTNGTLVTDLLGQVYMLAEGVVGQYRQGMVKRTFRMVRLDQQFSWERPVTAIHPVAKVAANNGTDPLGMVYCLLDPADERLERGYRVATTYERWKLYTNVALQLNDVLDGRLTVVRVEQIAGITLADVQ